MKNPKNLEVNDALKLALAELEKANVNNAGTNNHVLNAIEILKSVKPNNVAKDQADNAIPNADKLINWIDDTHRAKASNSFPEGGERQIATRFENLFDRLKTLNK